MASTAYTHEADMIAELRELIGQGTSTKALTDVGARACLAAARRQLNLRRPKYTFGSFATVASTATYAAGSASGTPPTDRLEKLAIYWLGDATTYLPAIPAESYDPDDDGATRLYGRTLGDKTRRVLIALQTQGASYTTDLSDDDKRIAFEAHDRLVRFFSGRGFDNASGSIILSPTPSSALRCYWIAKEPRFDTAASVTEDWSEALMAYAQFRACQIVAQKQAEAMDIDMGAGGPKLRNAGGRTYAERALDAYREWDALCPLEPTVGPVG